MDIASDIERAREMGKAAYEADEPRIPAAHKTLMSMCQAHGAMSKNAQRLMRAFLSGYDQAVSHEGIARQMEHYAEFAEGRIDGWVKKDAISVQVPV